MSSRFFIVPWVIFASVASAEMPPQVGNFLKEHCIECQGAEKQKGGVRLDTLPADFANFTHAETWLNVMDQLNSSAMPPEKKPRPPQREATALVERIAGQLRAAEAAAHPARLRRLSRYEYERTVGDLFGIHYRVPEDFPEDPTHAGFDNNAGALAISHDAPGKISGGGG